jgi:L-gulonolactone oxidase
VLSDPPAVRYEQTEWALPREDLPDAVHALLAALADGLETGLPVRMRLGAAESGWLHPAHERATGWVAVRVPRGTDPGPVLGRAAEVLRDHGGRPHWGTRHEADAADVAADYPRLPDFLRVREDYDPDRVFTNPALARLLGD